MEIQKLVAASFTGKGVTGLPDTPNLSASEMQAKFDELSKDVLAPKINEVIDGLAAAEQGAEDYYEQATALTQAHMDNAENPHQVTAEQTGAATPEFVLNAIATAGGGGTGMPDHTVLIRRDQPDQHPISAITGLTQAVQQLEAMHNGLGAPNGIATLDGDGKLEQMPTSADVGLPVESGTFTPYLTTYLGTTEPTATYEQQTGYYLKIGSLIYIAMQIQGNITSIGDGYAGVGGLPFSGSQKVRYSPVTIGSQYGLVNPGFAYISYTKISFRSGFESGGTASFGNGPCEINISAVYSI